MGWQERPESVHPRNRGRWKQRAVSAPVTATANTANTPCASGTMRLRGLLAASQHIVSAKVVPNRPPTFAKTARISVSACLSAIVTGLASALVSTSKGVLVGLGSGPEASSHSFVQHHV
jgi:hypothetical protein